MILMNAPTKPRLLIFTGASYSTLRAALVEIAKCIYLPLAGFGDLSAKQIAAHAGLTLEHARLAKMRDADEPFFIDRDDTTFSAAVIMVIVTTLITPPVLKLA
jgi:hypothetical protein